MIITSEAIYFAQSIFKGANSASVKWLVFKIFFKTLYSGITKLYTFSPEAITLTVSQGRKIARRRKHLFPHMSP